MDVFRRCIWLSPDILFIEHYCELENAPARSFSVWSKRWGVIQFYQEKLDARTVREISINQFAFYLNPYLPADLTTLDLAAINSILETVYNQFNPACWSTNFDLSTGAPQANCYRADITRFVEWRDETQRIVKSAEEWDFYWQIFKMF